MHRFVQTLLRFVPHRDADGTLHLNRIAQGSSYDRALAAFKAEQAKRAERNVRMIEGEWKSSRN